MSNRPAKIQPFSMLRRMMGSEGAASWERGARSPSAAYAVREHALVWFDELLETYGPDDPRTVEIMEILAEWSDAWEPPISRELVIPKGYRHARLTMPNFDSFQHIVSGSTMQYCLTPTGPFTPYALFIKRSYAPCVSIGIQAMRKRCVENVPGEMFARPGGRRIECPTVYPAIPLCIEVTNRTAAAIPRFDGVVDGYEPIGDEPIVESVKGRSANRRDPT